MALNEEHFNQWIAALRSGNYIQGKECLFTEFYDGVVERTIVSHCCLGVGCEISHVPMVEEQPLPTSEFIKWLGLEPSLSHTSQMKDFDDPTLEWNIGIFTGEPGESLNGGSNLGDSNMVNVASLNDGTGGHEQHDFEQIAAWLEANKDKLVAL